MEEGLELAAVQMPPDPFIGVIVERSFSLALRTGPLDPFGMLDPDVNSLFFGVQFDPADGPGVYDTEQMLIQGGVAHYLTPFLRQTLSRPSTH